MECSRGPCVSRIGRSRTFALLVFWRLDGLTALANLAHFRASPRISGASYFLAVVKGLLVVTEAAISFSDEALQCRGATPLSRYGDARPCCRANGLLPCSGIQPYPGITSRLGAVRVACPFLCRS